MTQKTWHFGSNVDRELESLYNRLNQSKADTARREESEVGLIPHRVSWMIGAQPTNPPAATRLITARVMGFSGQPLSRGVVFLWMSATENGPPAALGATTYTVETGVELVPRSGYLAGTFLTDVRGTISVEVSATALTLYFMLGAGQLVSASKEAIWS